MIKATHALLMVSGVLGNNSNNGSGDMTNDAKNALLAILGKVAYVNENGQTYYDALETALFPPPGLESISAVFNQGSAVIYDTDSLDTLKQYLTVTALYSDSSTEVVTTYTLSGTLAVGTSTITVSYGGKTTTFTVTVSERQALSGYTEIGSPTISDGILTVSQGNFVKTPYLFEPGSSPWKVVCKYRKTSAGSINQDVFGSVDSSNASARGLMYELGVAAGTQVGMYLSSNGTSWDINSTKVNITHAAQGDWFWVSFEFDGSSYILKYSEDGETYTTAQTVSSLANIQSGYAVAYGLKRNNVLAGEIDLNECKIYIDGVLWWKAIA